jgi:general secretion pathway protein L
MTFLLTVADEFFCWIDCVATVIVGLLGRIGSSRVVRLVEENDGAFSVHAQEGGAGSCSADERLRMIDGRFVGSLPASVISILKASQVELVLQPSHFLFRPLELPQRASEFLAGIVRAHIDRLTPWSAADAAFGWSAPGENESGRIVVMVAATAREFVTRVAQAIADLDVDSITMSTVLEEPDVASITVFSQRIRGIIEIHRLRRVLLVVLIASSLVAVSAIALDAILGGYLEARQDNLAGRIAERKNTILASRDTGTSALGALAQRKRLVPSSVIVLEALSQILPDHTYVTELRIEGSRMQIVGLTQDAPSLIRLIEQSSHFSRATFFAPTTRSPSETGERFHIEAQIQPVYTVGS